MEVDNRCKFTPTEKLLLASKGYLCEIGMDSDYWTLRKDTTVLTLRIDHYSGGTAWTVVLDDPKRKETLHHGGCSTWEYALADMELACR